MHSSLASLSLVALLSTVPHAAAAPTKRQFWAGGRYGGSGGSGGSGRPESRPQAWRPPWISPGSNSQQWNSPPDPVASLPDPTATTTTTTSSTVSSIPTAPVPSAAENTVSYNDVTTVNPSDIGASSDAVQYATSIATETISIPSGTQQIVSTSSSDAQTISPDQTTFDGILTSLDTTTTTTIDLTATLATFTSAVLVSSPSASDFSSLSSLSSSITTTTTAQSSSIASSSSSTTFFSTVVATTIGPFANTTSSTASQTSSTVSESSFSLSTSTSNTASESSSSSFTASSSSSSASSSSQSPTPSTTATSASPNNMLNGTFPNNSPPASPPQATPGLNIDLINTFSTTDAVFVYITAIDSSGRVMFLTPSQTWFYPSSSSSTIPEPVDASLIRIPLGSAEGSTTTLNLPGYFSSGRVYFARSGSLAFFTLLNPQSGVTIVTPNPLNPTDASYNTDWTFVEMTYTADGGLFANLSFVDFLSRLPLGMQLTLASGAVQTVQGTSSDSVDAMCAKLAAQTAVDGQPWDQLCQRGGGTNNTTSSSSSSSTGESSSQPFLRANSPAKYIAAVDSSAFATYWDAYVTGVWQQYASQDLLVDTQRDDLGVVRCSTASGNLVCDSSSRPLPAPISTSSFFTPPSSSAALDIFACSGIFSSLPTDNALTLALLPRICAAINRSVLLLSSSSSGNNTTTTTTTPSISIPPSAYYPDDVSATNYYAKFVHEVQRDGKGYAFAYDDVAPDSALDVSGSVAGKDLSAGGGGAGAAWRVWVGGMPL